MKITSTSTAQAQPCGYSPHHDQILDEIGLPPGLPDLEELSGDIERLITSVVKPYVDPSNPMLHFDELQAECRFRLAMLLSAGKLRNCPTREKLFGMLKVCFRNHTVTQVQKHVYAFKRTGIKPPPRKLWLCTPGSDLQRHKPVKISMDDPESHLQVGVWDELPDCGRLELMLTGEECAVVYQLAKLAGDRNQNGDPAARRRSRCPSTAHLAAELEFTPEDFAEIVGRIRSKCLDLLKG